MIELTDGVATSIVGLVTTTVAGWAGWFSLNSASKGPSWALSHLRRAVPIMWWLLGATGALAIAFRPIWMPAASLYVVAMALWIATAQRSSLIRVERQYGLAPVDPQTRVIILRRARLLMRIGAGVLGAIAVAILRIGMWPGLLALAMASVLAVVSWRLGSRL